MALRSCRKPVLAGCDICTLLTRSAQLTTVRDNLRDASIATTGIYPQSDELTRAHQISRAFAAHYRGPACGIIAGRPVAVFETEAKWVPGVESLLIFKRI